jgi:mycothiol S-conjugate amidase
MAVHAHPDDESSKGAATSARYSDRGVDVLVVSCTGGERGDVLNPNLKNDPHIARDLAQVRRDEMRRAQEILGVQHTWLGFVDSGLPEGDPLPPLPEGCFALEPLEVTNEALVREIRRFRPHVMTTYDETGGYPHPDHIMTHTVSMAAFEAAGDPAAYPHAGAPWQPLKIYYNAHSRAKYAAFHAALVERGMESPYADWLKGWDESKARPVTTRIHCAEWFDRRDQALLAHATQIDPDGAWFHVPRDLQQEVWPTEDFEAAVSFVPVLPGEEDLFAGIPDAASGDRLATADSAKPVFDARVGATS